MRRTIEAALWLLGALLFTIAATYALLFTDVSATAMAVGGVAFAAMCRIALLEGRLRKLESEVASGPKDFDG